MEIYRKNYRVTTKAQAIALLEAQDDSINNPVIGKPAPMLDGQLLKIWNNGERLDWRWEEETKGEYERRIEQENAEAEELGCLKSDNKHFKNVKLRPWRDQKLREWIDDTFQRPLLYDFKPGQEQERIDKRQELLDWPGLKTFKKYQTDEQIEDLQPSPPSWVSGG